MTDVLKFMASGWASFVVAAVLVVQAVPFVIEGPSSGWRYYLMPLAFFLAGACAFAAFARLVLGIR